MPRIFGREPAVWLALIATSIRLLSAFWLDLSIDQQSILNAVATAVAGLVVAMLVHDGQVAAVLGFVQAALALAIGMGLEMSPEAQAVIMSFVSTVIAMFVRTQVVAPVPADAV